MPVAAVPSPAVSQLSPAVCDQRGTGRDLSRGRQAEPLSHRAAGVTPGAPSSARGWHSPGIQLCQLLPALWVLPNPIHPACPARDALAELQMLTAFPEGTARARPVWLPWGSPACFLSGFAFLGGRVSRGPLGSQGPAGVPADSRWLR